MNDQPQLRVLVTGDRTWGAVPRSVPRVGAQVQRAQRQTDVLTAALTALVRTYGAHNVALAHGGARGADTLAGTVATQLGCVVREFPADWARYRRGGGVVRNQEMLDVFAPTLVLAFHDDFAHSRGTRDCVRRALRRAGCAVWLHSTTGPERLLHDGDV